MSEEKASYGLQVEREMDAAIAEKVMGWKLKLDFHPSTNIADAMEVADKLMADGWEFQLRKHPRNKLWDASFDGTGYTSVGGRGETAPEAICRAALQIVELGLKAS